MQPTLTSLSDLDAAFDVDEYWQGHRIQLSPGPLGFRAAQWDWEGLYVRIYSVDRPLRCREAYCGPHLFLALPLELSNPVHWSGSELPTHTGAVFSKRREVNYVLPGGSSVLEVCVDQSIAGPLGWDPKGEPLRRCDTRLVPSFVAGLSRSSYVDDDLDRDAVLSHVAAIFGRFFEKSSEIGVPPSRFAPLVRRAEELIQAQSSQESVTVPWLAGQLRTSERTLYAAFQSVLGTSPYRYVLLHRLHAVRRALIRAKLESGVVTRELTRAGFTDASRAGQMYNRHFGETPRETLRSRVPSG